MNNVPFKRRTYADTFEQLRKEHPEATNLGLGFEALGIMADETHAMARLAVAGLILPLEEKETIATEKGDV